MVQRPATVRLADFITPRSITPTIEAGEKPEVIKELAGLLFASRPELGRQISQAEACRLLMEREELAATGIGNAIAIPHASTAKIKQLIGGFARSEAGVDFGSIDRVPCHFFFILLSPMAQPKIHIKALSRISRVLGVASARQALMAASTVEEIFAELMAGDEYLDTLRNRKEQP